jgi:hypothetical protein
MSYEGGPDHVILPGGNQPYPDAGRRQRAVYRHPRFYPLIMHMLGRYQAGGMERFHFYQLSGYEHIEGGGPDVNGWAAYVGTDELPYEPGDDAQDAIQINTPNRADLIKSITGGAMKAWAALLGGGSGGLVAGSVSGAATSGTTASLSSSTPSGGTAPYTRQWTRDGVSVSGATAATLNDAGLTPGQTSSYRVRYTDSTAPTPLTATSSAFSITTPGGSGGGGMGSIPISSVWGLRRLRLRG